MMLRQSEFFRLFGDGLPTTATVGDLDRMQYGSIDDRRVLLAVARAVHPATVVEFGVQAGNTAALLLAELPCIRKYVGIDLPLGDLPVLPGQAPEVPAAPGGLVADHPAFRLIRARSESLTAKQLPAADLIFVDGGHDYETVLADSLLARQIVKPGGVIIWHDYHNSTVDVTRVIDSLNQAEGDHICLVEGTWVCLQFAATLGGDR